MKIIIDSYTGIVPATVAAPESTVRVFITSEVIPHCDKVVLKRLVNSTVDIMGLESIQEARDLYNELLSEDKINLSVKGVSIRYKKWYPTVSCDNTNTKDSDTDTAQESAPKADVNVLCYDENIVNSITEKLASWCKTRIFPSFVSFEKLREVVREVVAERLAVDTLNEEQIAFAEYCESKFASRYTVLCPFNSKGYNLGHEIMLKIYPNRWLKYRLERYTRNATKVTYFFICQGKLVDSSGKGYHLTEGTLTERSKLGLKIDCKLHFSNYI